MKKYIELPEEIARQLTEEVAGKENALILETRDDKFVIKLTDNVSGSRQNFSLHRLLIPSLLSWFAALIAFIMTKQEQIILTGDEIVTVGNVTLAFGAVTGFFSFLVAYIKSQHIKLKRHWLTKLRETLTLTVTYTLVILAIAAIIFYVMRHTFNGVSFDPVTASLFVLVFSAIMNYFMISAAVSVRVSDLINMLFTTSIGGIFLAMAMNSQKDWWQINFSFLGTARATDNWQFNFTLVFSALILLTITDYLFSEFSRSSYYTAKARVVRFFYYLLALLIACVGIFPANIGSWTRLVHNWAAYGIVMSIGVLILLLKWLLPDISKEFMIVSAVTMGLLILAAILFKGVHYLSLTFFEIISFAIAFVWLVMLINTMQEMTQADHRWHVKLIEKTEKNDD
ncbi:ABC transporter permease [Lactococcus hodotermopsidis]|uniref:ABC transporter permease n=1 Tax=Pseudolactococcus hodotermopsidis TaxID=2709157 RepID=A0A6A0BBD1_9LACT|nr:DUF998 domain-containing protein [Lactococcus hodotermopsidis]GFH41771.1 ABC transporter permease [Lactococcus hodotermopsidis]